MAEVLGTALSIVGAVGVLGQIFDGCIKAYSIFTTASNLGRDSERLVCKIRIEEMRLLIWGREWGVMEGRFEAQLHAGNKVGNQRMTQLATQILSELYRTITDFKKLQEKYGLKEEDAEEQPSIDILREKQTSKSKSPEPNFPTRLRNELKLRAKWVIADKEKFIVLLQDLKDYNDGLEQLFPFSRLATIQRAWTNELLQVAQKDLGKLNILEAASSGVYPQLSASASLKQLKINLETKPQASFRQTFALKIPRDTLSISDSFIRRSCGAYKSFSTMEAQNVVAEWVDYDREDLDGRLNHIRRIDDLARMIHSASERHPDLHTIDCLGYTDDSDKSRYGLIYRAPEETFSSLHSLLTSKDLRSPDLGDRFRLAHTLAIAVWSLHSLDWLHKSVCSSNILFFPSATTSSAKQSTAAAAVVPNISAPCLVGFDASRPDHLTEMSVASQNTSTLDLYRHPDSLDALSRKQYCKSYDIYSLGLVLLEIGLWKPLQSVHKPHYSVAKFRDRVITPVLVPGLGSKTGSIYREVVEKCLAARYGLGHEAGQLMEWVVGTLETLRV